MTGVLPRRSLLTLFGMAPIAAASGASAPVRLGRLANLGGFDFRSMTYGRVAGLDVQEHVPLGAMPRAPLSTTEERAGFQADARSIAATALVFPPEIAAYRSSAPHLRRRLYAELLAREAERLVSASAPSTTRQPPPGSGV